LCEKDIISLNRPAETFVNYPFTRITADRFSEVNVYLPEQQPSEEPVVQGDPGNTPVLPAD
jgi:hypothetical protein